MIFIISALLITGGLGDDASTVEVFSLKTFTSHTLPNLPSGSYDHAQHKESFLNMELNFFGGRG